jgi:predicted MFS family arabinose efflux permease
MNKNASGNGFFAELRGGWRDLLGGAIGMGCGIGGYTTTTSFFFRALEQEFHWSKVAAAASLLALPLTAAVLPLAGGLIDRFGVRRVVVLSSFALTAALWGLSVMDGGLVAFYALSAALNVFGCATGPVGYTRNIAMRFSAGRGVALALALVGIAAAGAILPNIIAPTIAQHGWRAGYQLLAEIVFVGGLVSALLLTTGRAKADTHAAEGDTLGGALRQARFWLLGTAIFLISAGSIGFVSQIQSLSIEKGFEAAMAPKLLAVLAISTFLSRILVGWALDITRAERIATIVLIVAASAAGAWLSPTGLAGAIVAAVLLGLANGAELDLMSFFCARLFGLAHYGAIYGALAAFFYFGIAAGAIAYGAIHDMTGAYTIAVIGSGGAFFLAAIAFLALGRAGASRATVS